MQVSKNTQAVVNKELPFTGLAAFVERFQSIAQTMQRNQTFLIAGESGTGKTLLAKFICQHSPCYNKKTRIVRLDEIPDELLEKELFGHNGFEGRIKAADEGTLILKDVAHLPWHLQAKFLRLLEENEFERLGETAAIKMNLRTVFVTSENLFQAALENRFRQDLYYKLAATEITIPPLRNRKEDIEPLSLYYLNCTALQQRKNLERIDQGALNALQNYGWPGNVRELKTEIELAVAKVASEKQALELDDLSPNVRFKLPQPHSPSYHFAEKIKLVERQMIIAAIENNHGNKVRAAKFLGVKHRTLYEKMKALDIPLSNHKPLE